MYEVIPDAAIIDQVAALPVVALEPYAQVLAALAVAPWNGPSQHQANPDAAVRRWSFGPDGAGQVVYLILDDQREVHLLLVQWLGP